MQLREMLPGPLTFGNPICIHGLGVVPLLWDRAPELPPMDLLDEALGKGTLRVIAKPARAGKSLS
jgi:hypothetical protein